MNIGAFADLQPMKLTRRCLEECRAATARPPEDNEQFAALEQTVKVAQDVLLWYTLAKRKVFLRPERCRGIDPTLFWYCRTEPEPEMSRFSKTASVDLRNGTPSLSRSFSIIRAHL